MLYLAAVGRPLGNRKQRPSRLEANNSLRSVVGAVLGHHNLVMAVAFLLAAVVLSLTYQWATTGEITAFKVATATGIGGLTVGLLGILVSRLSDRKAERRHQEIIGILNRMDQRQQETSSQIVTAISEMTERLEAALTHDADR